MHSGRTWTRILGVDSLTQAIVRVLAADGSVSGTGFVVSADGLIATCAHVIQAANAGPGQIVRVSFNATGETLSAKVEPDAWRSQEAEDIAFLRLNEPLPETIEALPLGPSINAEGRPFKTFGFPEIGVESGVWGEGHIQGEIHINNVRLLQVRSPEVTRGFSGAPVWDAVAKRVIGLVVGILAIDAYGRLRETGYITPSETLQQVYPSLSLLPPAKLTEYRTRILEETRYVNLRGIPLPRDRSGRPISPNIPLARVYIRIQALAEKQQRAAEERERQHVETEKRNFVERLLSSERNRDSERPTDFMATIRVLGEYLYRRGDVFETDKRPEPIEPHKALAEHKRLVLLGAPGAGKSTLLRHLAHEAAGRPGGPVPVLVSLGKYASARAVQPTLTLRDYALAHVSAGDDALRTALDEMIETGHVLWLVDAVDEAHQLASEATQQAGRLPGQLMITSRPLGYVNVGLESLPHFEILPLSSDDAWHFFVDWFSVLHGEAEGNRAHEQANWLDVQLKQRRALRPLTGNPLLLTFLVILAGRQPSEDLPTQRAELYRRYVTDLLDSWEWQRRQTTGRDERTAFTLGLLAGEAAREAALLGFYYLGWALHLTYYGGQSARKPTRDSLAAQVADYFRPRWGVQAEAVAKAVLEFWQEAGLLETWELSTAHNGRETYLAFRHLTLQEYAAAWGLAEILERDPKSAWRFLKPHLHHYAWREPILLFANLLDHKALDLLARHLLREPSPYEHELCRDLELLADSIGEGANISDDLKAKVAHRLIRLARNHKRDRINTLWIYCAVWLTSAGAVFWLLAQSPLTSDWFAWVGIALILILEIGRFAPLIRDYPLAQFYVYAYAHYWLQCNRKKTTSALLNFGEMAVLPLIDQIADDDPDVCEAAIDALGKLGNKRAVMPLIDLLSANRFLGYTHLAATARALGLLGDLRAVGPLIEYLARGRPTMLRVAAIEALGHLGDVQAIKALKETLLDDDPDVRAIVAKALERFGESHVEPRHIQGPTDYRWLVVQLDNKDWRTREATVKALGQLGDRRAVGPLIGQLADNNDNVRRAVVEALGQLGEPAVLPLIDSLTAGDWLVRESAAKALGHLADARAVQPLIELLTDKYWPVRVAVIEALACVGNADIVPIFIERLAEIAAESHTREAVTKFLVRFGDTHTATMLLIFLAERKSSSSAIETSIEALSHLGDKRAIPSLIGELANITNDSSLRRTAAIALGRLGDRRAVDVLLACSKDRNNFWIGEAAIVALGKMAVHISDMQTLRKIMFELWWCLTDAFPISHAAFDSLSIFAQRVFVLRAEAFPLYDPLLPRRRSTWQRWIHVCALTMALSAVALLVGILINIISSRIELTDAQVLVGLIGALVFGAIGIFLQRWLDKNE